MGLILFVLGFVFSIFLSSLIAVPLIGTLVRFRANYTPKGLQLDQEGGAEAHVGPVVTSYFAMLLRVKRIEVNRGLYAIWMSPNSCSGMAGLVQGIQ